MVASRWVYGRRRLGLRPVVGAATFVVMACGAGSPAVAPKAPEPSPEASPTSTAPKPAWRTVAPLSSMISENEYQLPPVEVIELLQRESAPGIRLHPKSRQLARLYEQKLIPREQMARPRLPLAGFRVDVANRTRAGTPFHTRILLSSFDDPTVREIRPPEGALFGDASFSPQGNRLLVSVIHSDRVGVGVYDFAAGAFVELTTGPLSAFWGEPCSWVNDDELSCARPQHLDDPPLVEVGPNIRELTAGAAPAVSYGNLLRDANDDALFEHYGAVELVRVTVDSDTTTATNIRGMILESAVSPDGRFVLTTRVRRPYSRLLPVTRFPRVLVVHDSTTGDVVATIGAGESGLTSKSNALGPSSAAWDPNQPASLVYANRALDGSGQLNDQLFETTAPFESPHVALGGPLRRISGWGWTTGGSLYATDTGDSPRSWSAYVLRKTWTSMSSGRSDETLGDPLEALRVRGPRGPVLEHLGKVYFNVTPSARDERTRLVEWTIDGSKQQELWWSRPGEYAEVLTVVDPAAGEFLLSSEAPQSPAHLALSKDRMRRSITRSAPAAPELAHVRRRIIRYARPDGVPLSGILYLPPGHEPGRPVPTVLWVYPHAYDRGRGEASQAYEDAHRYFDVRGASRFAILTQGYALFEPGMPIVGGENADAFVPQLVQNARSAIDALVGAKLARRDQVAVMGRSYGAFAVANLLAHSRLFRTGIALSGAYNRTLTPFGFQQETKTFWQNTDTYVNVSPFFFADELEDSILLMHGEEDDNAGTPALQSERFYAALAGNGVRVRYVSFPFEGHQFRGRDAVLHAAAETLRWLELHFRHPSR